MHYFHPIKALSDNYIWLSRLSSNSSVFVVDPGEAKPVLDYLTEHHLSLSAILVTHKHADHTGGIAALRKDYPEAVVYAHPEEGVPHCSHLVSDGEVFQLEGWSDPIRVIHIPGHTLGHVAYVMGSALFSGDTLFSAGCGRVFEGTMSQMYTSLQSLAALPETTDVYCGHEYTLDNLRFANVVEPFNSDIKDRLHTVLHLRDVNQCTLPSLLSIEKRTNPFLRCEVPSVIESAEAHLRCSLPTPELVFEALREWKNTWRSA